MRPILFRMEVSVDELDNGAVTVGHSLNNSFGDLPLQHYNGFASRKEAEQHIAKLVRKAFQADSKASK